MEKPLTTIIEESIDLKLYIRDLDNLIKRARELHADMISITDTNVNSIDIHTSEYLFKKYGIEPLGEFIDRAVQERDIANKKYLVLCDLRNKKMN